MGRGRSSSRSRSRSGARSGDVAYSGDIAYNGFVYRSRYKDSFLSSIFGSSKPYSPEELVENYPGEARVNRRSRVPDYNQSKLSIEVNEILERSKREDCERYLQIALETLRLHPECAHDYKRDGQCTEHNWYRKLLAYSCDIELLTKSPTSSSPAEP